MRGFCWTWPDERSGRYVGSGELVCARGHGVVPLVGQELATLLGSAKRAENCAGEIAVDDFVDWIFAAQGNPSGGSGSM